MKSILFVLALVLIVDQVQAANLNCMYQHKDLKTNVSTEASKVFKIESGTYDYKLREVHGSEITIFTTMVEGEIAIVIHDGEARVSTTSADKVIRLQAYPINNSEYYIECYKE